MDEQQSVSQAPQSTLMKDLMIPISIVIAGGLVGLGLFLSNSSSSDIEPIALGGQQQAQVPPTGPEILIPQLVQRAGVDQDDFTQCFQEQRTANKVKEDSDNAVATGGRGTPWNILIGPTGQKYPINGAVPQQAIEQLITLVQAGSAGEVATEAGIDLDAIAPITENDHIRGDINAPITIVEYSDFDCPFCSRHHATMEIIVEKYDGQVAWVYRHFPLPQLHPNAEAVAIASECVAELGGEEAFWTFTDGYFAGR